MSKGLIKGWPNIMRELQIDSMQTYALGFALRGICNFREWAEQGGMPVWYLHDIDDEPRIFRGELLQWARKHDLLMNIPEYTDDEKKKAWDIIYKGQVKKNLHDDN